MGKFTLGRKEKESRVCELLREGKTVREIAEIEHVNFSEIGRIKKKYFNVEDEESARPSKRSLALEMFQEGKSDVDIAKELDLSAKETLEYRLEYFTLTDDDLIVRIYHTIGGDMSSFVTLYKEMKIEDLSAEDAVWALSQNRTFNQMTLEYESLLKKLSPLRQEVERLEKEKIELAEQNRAYSELMDAFRDAIENIPQETNPSPTDDNWTKRVHRRRRIKNPEHGFLDPAKLFGTFP